jgi:hypothetical protein
VSSYWDIALAIQQSSLAEKLFCNPEGVKRSKASVGAMDIGYDIPVRIRLNETPEFR